MKQSTLKLMFLGSGSDVGKSLLTTAFCRILYRRGISVTPFKAQNMALNSFVTMDGKEMGRAQVIQAYAAGLQPTSEMNPVLLKPSGGNRIQVILNGEVCCSQESFSYYRDIERIRNLVINSFRKLEKQFQAIILEGAGSAIELNLTDRDIVNISMALAVKAPAILVSDIDRGGVFAASIGSIKLLKPKERKIIIGHIINKFRGDIGLFENGKRIIEKRSRKPVFGIIPYIQSLNIPEEDSVALDRGKKGSFKIDSEVRIAVIRLPFISNYTDFDPFEMEENVSLWYAESPEKLNKANVIIIPGTKNTISDLIWMKKSGFEEKIKYLVKRGVTVVGICGGYQIMGDFIYDPYSIESKIKEIKGLSLIGIKTTMSTEKTLKRVKAICQIEGPLKGKVVSGYEIHMGKSKVDVNIEPSFRIVERNGKRVNDIDGAVVNNGKIWGTYIHGLFENDDFRSEFLHMNGRKKIVKFNYHNYLEKQFDRLADTVEEYVDVQRILKLAQRKSGVNLSNFE